MARYHLEWPIFQYDEFEHVIEPCGFKKEPWSWKQGPPLIFDLLSHFYAIGILRKWNISLVFSTSSGDDFYGWRRRQEIGKLLCWKWNHGNCQSQGSANQLVFWPERSMKTVDSPFEHPLSPDKSSEKIYRSWRSWNIRFVYQRKISMCSTLGGKCLRKIHRRVSFISSLTIFLTFDHVIVFSLDRFQSCESFIL